MKDSIKFYFVCVSPWSYLALNELKTISLRHNCNVIFKPIDVVQLWKQTGAGKALNDRPKILLSYRLFELERWKLWRDLEFNSQPKYHPVSYNLSSSVIVSGIELGINPFEITKALMRGCWVDEKNISDHNDVSSIIQSLDLDTKTIMDNATSENVKEVISQNTQEAFSDGIWSVPSFAVNNEPFFGQDRLEMIDWHLSLQSS